MPLIGPSSRFGFFRWTTACAVGLLIPTILGYLGSGLFEEGPWNPGRVWVPLPAWIGTFLPFAAFAGGVAVHGVLSAGGVLKRGLVIAILSYGLLAYASPVAQYLDRRNVGGGVSAVYPFGPNTPHGRIANRSAVEASPPEEYSFRVEDPLSTPPNWLTYLLHSTVVFAVFSVLSALLGQLAARLTTGLSPPKRRNARWALGLASGSAFFAAEAAGGEWARADPSNSGLFGAWLPLVVPFLGLGVLLLLVRWRRPDDPGLWGPEAR